jgi:DNA-binding beta-propeller fold protein YncE
VSGRRLVPAAVTALLIAGCGDGEVRGRSAVPSAAQACPAPAPLRVAARVRVGPGVGPVTTAGATLWAARPAAGVLVPVRGGAKPRTGRPVRVGGAPVSLAAGFGGVFVADRDRDRVLRVDAAGRTVVRWAGVQAPIKVGVAGDELFAISLDDGALYRMPGRTRGIGADIPIPARAPVDAVYEAGDTWVLGGADGGLAPFSLRQNRFVRVGVKLPVRVVGAVAAGQDAVWAALPTARSVARLDSSTASLSVLRASPGFRPTAIAVDDCTIWVGDPDGRVQRIDPRGAGPLHRPVRIGRSLAALAADRGGVWASDPRDGTVVRIAPRR